MSLRPAVELALFEALGPHTNQALPSKPILSVISGPGPGEFTFPDRLVPDLHSATRRIVEEIRASKPGQDVQSDEAWPRDTPAETALYWIIHRYLELTGTLRTDPEVFGQVWNEFLTYVASESVSVALSAPLLGFSAEFNTLRVAEGVSIEKISPEWKQARWEDSTFDQSIGDFGRQGWADWTHMVRCVAGVAKALGPDLNELQTTAQRVVTALRLLLPGGVAIAMSWLDPLMPVFGVAPHKMAFSSMLGWQVYPPRMNWQGSEDDLSRIYARLPPTSLPTVSLALRRFEGAYGRISDEDRLIDYWIGLEALFLADRQNELSYLGPLRIARFLEQDRSARTAVFDRLRKSYGLRSQIVHGKHPGNVHATTVETEHLLRTALAKMLLNGAAPTEQQLQDLLLD
jgi:hypothetical protein